MHELRVNTSSRSPEQISNFGNSEAIKMKKGTSLDHILKEITNFGGLEAETQASLQGLMGWEKAKSIDAVTKDDDDIVEQSFKTRRDKFKDVLINENLVIIEKEKTTKVVVDNKTIDDVDLTSKEKFDVSNEMPVPNTVRRYKDIFETLSKTLDVVSKNPTRKSVSRSISVRVTTADWRQTKPEYREIVNKLDVDKEDRRRTLPGRLVIPKSPDEIEQARDWLNACSPVTPDVIQKLREHGTSVTFFGRQAYSPSNSPTQDEDWSLRKPRVVGVTPKYVNNVKPPSLSSSSTCSDEELHFTSSFDYPSTDSEYLRNQLDDDSGHDEDSYTYDVVFLDGAYSRSATPQLAFRNKGVWLRDPFWSGSNYIVYDFRGTDVQPHVRVDAR